MIREFVISVASGFAVAVLSAIFLRRTPKSGTGQTQSMSMNSNTGPGPALIIGIFLLGAMAVFAGFVVARGGLPAW